MVRSIIPHLTFLMRSYNKDACLHALKETDLELIYGEKMVIILIKNQVIDCD